MALPGPLIYSIPSPNRPNKYLPNTTRPYMAIPGPGIVMYSASYVTVPCPSRPYQAPACPNRPDHVLLNPIRHYQQDLNVKLTFALQGPGRSTYS